MIPSDEQGAIIERAGTGDSFRVLAFAGTGKTTTLQFVAEKLSHRRILYLVYNRAAATAAKQRFAAFPHVRPMTAHGLAYAALDDDNRTRIKSDADRTWREFLVARGAFRDLDPALRPRATRAVLSTLTQFLASVDETVLVKHVPTDLEDLDIEFIASIAKRLCFYIENEYALPISHEWYLKQYQLSHPILRTDLVLYDEAQDATPSMLDIVESQTRIQRIYCGDSHQQLYSFRGAVNALESIGLPALPLTESRRFGPDIAAAANAILAVKGERFRLKGISPEAGAIKMGYARPGNVVLARSNMGLIERAMVLVESGAKIFIRGATNSTTGNVGSGAGELMSGLLSAFDLKQGKLSKHPTFQYFQTWDELVEASGETGGEALRPYVRMVEKHGRQVPRVVSIIRDNCLETERGANVILSTVHRFKGEEASVVTLGDDFHEFVDDHFVMDDTEANVAYVAVTRAQKELFYGGAFGTIDTSTKRRKIDMPITSSLRRPMVQPVKIPDIWRPSVPRKVVVTEIPHRTYRDLVPGSRWRHPHEGIVTIEDATSLLITVRAADGTEKKLGTLAAYPRLTAVINEA